MQVRTLRTNTTWKRIEPAFRQMTQRGPRQPNNRRFLEEVLWIWRTGAHWRDLPPSLGPWASASTSVFAAGP